MIETLFPANDFSLIGIILALPLLGAFVNGVFGRRLGKDAVRLMALFSIGAAFVLSIVAFLALDKHITASGSERYQRLTWTAWEWMKTTRVLLERGNPSPTNVAVPIEAKFSIDALSAVMMLIVTGVGFLIHLYATSYMAKDKAFWRFFAYLNLFIFAMLVLILGDNLPVLFVGWEGVGLCSYLLIGFWYESMPNAAAGKKAFIANRIGDFGLIVAMFLLVHYCGALDWQGLRSTSDVLANNPSDFYQIHVWPIGGGQYSGILSFLQPSKAVTISAATAVGLMLLLGCAGKSAQIPLYVWLPDAMAGPTPVSALIHAATMVTAGVYLVCRMSFVFALSPFVMATVAVVGAATAMLAATIALVQNDIKKVLAYSTVSQLGFMFVGVGVGAFTAGFFHVFTHAFFKACLFLGAGSVIHAMHARIHDDVKSQDMRYMGGLKKYMPFTYWTFLMATLAIAGAPLFSGFFSKDEILFKAFVSSSANPFAAGLTAKGVTFWTPPSWLGPALYVVMLASATMTAFYMFRCFFLTFHGTFRGWEIGRGSAFRSLPALEEVEHDHEDAPEHHHTEEDLTVPGRAPHESPWQMTVPLIILAAFSCVAGFLNPAPITHALPMDHWLEPVFEATYKIGGDPGPILTKADAHSLAWPLAFGGIAAFAIGTGIAYWMYMMKAGEPAKELSERMPGLYKLLYDKWRVDELYEKTVLAAVDALADTMAQVDRYIVDGILARGTALVVAAFGHLFRAFQNGVVHVYAMAMVIGLAALAWHFGAPHPEGTVTEKDGDYVVEAGPGMGYMFRWDADGDGKADTDFAPSQTSVKVHLEPGKTQNVTLEVKNAFGFVAAKKFVINRADKLKVLEVGQGMNNVPGGQ
jgi:NADH-quinone oxidoreductase subunit L